MKMMKNNPWKELNKIVNTKRCDPSNLFNFYWGLNQNNEYLFLLNELKKVDITEYDKVEGFKKWFNQSEYEFASEKESYDYKFFVNLEPEYDSYYSNTYAKLVGFKLYYYDAFLEKYNVEITLK